MIAIFLVLLWQGGAQAGETAFIFPAGCTYGEDCWAVNYVDTDTGDAAQDFTCGPKSYDGHKGTDFALGSVAQMRSGVDVLAAADGRVLRVRDGEDDHLKTGAEITALKEEKKECGNGVLIDHGDGLQTIYCHLKKGSVTAQPKQKVRAGEKIAQIGQSGLAEFPHLHFGVMWEGGVVDPYTGMLNTKRCGQTKEPLWRAGLSVPYEPVVIFGGGFQPKVPDFEAIKRGQDNPATLSLNSAAFVFWAGFYNVETGDRVVLKVTDPDGAIFVERRETVEKTRARQYYFTGRKIGKVHLKSGIYKGYVKIERGTIVREKQFTVNIL